MGFLLGPFKKYIYWPPERGGKRAQKQKTRTISSSLLLFSVEEPAAVDGSAEARNFLVLDGELVVVEDLLAWEQGLHGEEDDLVLAVLEVHHLRVGAVVGIPRGRSRGIIGSFCVSSSPRQLHGSVNIMMRR